jgi:hypothetical protein
VSQDAERLYIEAGRKLALLKTQYAMRKVEKRVTLRWAAFVKARVGVSKSRANELIQMGQAVNKSRSLNSGVKERAHRRLATSSL